MVGNLFNVLIHLPFSFLWRIIQISCFEHVRKWRILRETNMQSLCYLDMPLKISNSIGKHVSKLIWSMSTRSCVPTNCKAHVKLSIASSKSLISSSRQSARNFSSVNISIKLISASNSVCQRRPSKKVINRVSTHVFDEWPWVCWISILRTAG